MGRVAAVSIFAVSAFILEVESIVTFVESVTTFVLSVTVLEESALLLQLFASTVIANNAAINNKFCFGCFTIMLYKFRNKRYDLAASYKNHK
jgi:hypothetical protein